MQSNFNHHQQDFPKFHRRDLNVHKILNYLHILFYKSYRQSQKSIFTFHRFYYKLIFLKCYIYALLIFKSCFSLRADLKRCDILWIDFSKILKYIFSYDIREAKLQCTLHMHIDFLVCSLIVHKGILPANYAVDKFLISLSLSSFHIPFYIIPYWVLLLSQFLLRYLYAIRTTSTIKLSFKIFYSFFKNLFFQIFFIFFNILVFIGNNYMFI
jgi:hypothetical protein